MPKVFRHRNRDESGRGGGRGRGGGHNKFGGQKFIVDRNKSGGNPEFNSPDSGPSSNDKRVKKGYLDEGLMSYYRQVSTTLEAGFDEQENPEAKTQFISNVVDALKDEGVKVAQNQTVSRILEFLFTHSPPHLLSPVFVHFCSDLTTVVFDAFASHVFQALIQYLPLMVQVVDKGDDEANQGNQDLLKESLENLCTFMTKHLQSDTVMTHVYGSHVLRSLLEVLGGVPVRAEIVRSRMSRKTSYKEVGHGPEVNNAVMKQFSENNSQWLEKILEKTIHQCNYGDHLSDQNFCPLLQTVLLILHKTRPDQYKELASTITEKVCADTGLLGQGSSELRLPMLAQNQVGTYLLELLVSLAKGKELKDLYDKLFKGRLLHYAVHPCANYILQRLLTTIDDPDMMEEVYTDMAQYTEDILAVSHCGLVTALAQGLALHQVKQLEFFEVLMSAFHCREPESRQAKIVPLLAAFSTWEVFYEAKDDSKDEHKAVIQCSIHGSLLLQRLMTFTDPWVISSLATSLLGLAQSELVCLACDKCGSHCLSAFIASPSISLSHKDELLETLKGAYINLATNIHGSRCLENIWKHLTFKQRIFVAEDLCKGQGRLEGDRIGKFVYRNLDLYKFMNRRKDWNDIQRVSTKERKKQMLNQILEGQSSKKKKKQKNINGAAEIEIPSVTNETLQQKDEEVEIKKSKKEKKCDNESVQSQQPVNTSMSSTKKRKRKKEKRRLIRGSNTDEDLQNIEPPVKVKKSSTSELTLEDCENKKKSSKKKKKKKPSKIDI